MVHMVTLDGKGGQPDLLKDSVVTHELLKRLPKLMGMQVIREPELIHYDGKGNLLAAGDTGVEPYVIRGDTVIATSHVAIHCYPSLYALFFDAFSCLPFDPEPVRRAVMEAYGLSFERSRFQVVERDAEAVSEAIK